MNTESHDAQWWLLDGATPVGPLSFGAIEQQLLHGRLSPETQAIPEGGKRWRSLREWNVFPLPLPLPEQTELSAAKPVSAGHPSWAVLLVVAGILVLVGFRYLNNLFPFNSQQRGLADLKAQAVRDLNASKQTIFDQVHPMGQARSVDVHDVTLERGRGGEGLIVYRFTLHWQSPLISNGYTKLQVTFDPESQAVVDTQILATNGITHAQAQAMAFDFGSFLGEAARQQQQRQQAERLRQQGGF